MKKQHHIEHYLVPLALFCGNICFVHLLYAFEGNLHYSTLQKGLLSITIVILIVSLISKNKIALVFSCLFYGLILARYS